MTSSPLPTVGEAHVGIASGSPEPSGCRLSLVIPTFNEAGNIAELLSRVESALGPTGWEMIFVDDDSTDGTAGRVWEIARFDPRVRCLQRIGRRGLSSACIEGMLASSAQVIGVMDADLQHDETVLPRMLALLEAGEAEVVVGTRYAEGGSVGEWTAGRHQMSRLATAASRIVLRQPVSDPMSGFFMLRRDLLEATVRRLSGMGFKILLDLLASAPRKLRIAEVPYTFRDRHSGESKLDGLVVWEFGMLLADKTVGRYVPVRFLTFALVGALGVMVHMAVLTLLLKQVGLEFSAAQAWATVVAMIFNFAVNNVLTYRDRRLHGAAWIKGLLSFMLACSIGALANVGIATYLFDNRTEWVLAALAGIVIGAVWTYAVTQVYTWGKRSK